MIIKFWKNKQNTEFIFNNLLTQSMINFEKVKLKNL